MVCAQQNLRLKFDLTHPEEKKKMYFLDVSLFCVFLRVAGVFFFSLLIQSKRENVIVIKKRSHRNSSTLSIRFLNLGRNSD